MSDSQINVALILKLVDKITGPFKPVMDKVDKMKKQLGGVKAAGLQAAAGISKMTGGLRNAAGILTGFGAAAALATSQLIAPAADFETFMAILTALEGSAEKAGVAFDWVKQFATNTPLQMQGVLDAYQSLKTFGLDPTNGSLQALVDTNAKMGGDQYKLEGIILAVGQSWTKQKLQGEEALQLIERGVPVWDLLSKAMGKSAVEIQEMASSGELGRKEIQLLIDAMGADAAGAAEAQMATWKGMVSNLKDIWSNFQLSIMQNGLFDWMKGRLKLLLDTVNQMQADGRLTALAIEIGDNLKKTLTVIWDLAQGFAGMLRDVFPYIEQAKEMLGGWNELALTMLALPFASSFVAMAQGVAMVGAAMVKLGFIFLSNPILAAVALIAGGVYLIYRNWEAISGWFSDKFKAVKDAFNISLIDGLIALWTEFSPIELIKDGFTGLEEWLNGYDIDFQWSDLITSPLTYLKDQFDIEWSEIWNKSLEWTSLIFSPLKHFGEIFNFIWSDLLPDWNWGDIIPDLRAFFEDAGKAPPAYRGNRSEYAITPPARALGGSVLAGRLYQVNEAGVELFQPRVDGRIIPLGARSGATGDGGRRGDQITVGDIHIHPQPGQDAEAIAMAVRNKIMTAGRGPDRSLHDGGS